MAETSIEGTELCQLAEKHGTDKYPWYTPFYHALLKDRREFVQRVLEIGIGTVGAMSHVENYSPGASLRMWRDYFPHAEIWGLDRNLEAENEERISVFQGEQTNLQTLDYLAVCGPWDLIIDDGSHDPADQKKTFEHLYPSVRDGGLYIIEDVLRSLALPAPSQFVECCLPENVLKGRCIVIPK